MPSKNIVKSFVPDSYYHIYNRGINKQDIFKDDEDFRVFLNLLKRYLSDEQTIDNKGREYPWLYEGIELLAYCLMPNHFHLFVYLKEQEAMTKLLRGACTSYTTYFNKKYQRIGPLFQSNYKASHILQDAHLLHISRYIHLNPKDYQGWEYTSLPYYLGTKSASWIQPGRVLEMFEGGSYLGFLKDYVSKDDQDEFDLELANS